MEKRHMLYMYTVRCKHDNWSEIVKEFLSMFSWCEILDQVDTYVICSTWIPEEAIKRMGPDVDIFCDTVRYLANLGWPENDPLTITVREEKYV